MKYDVIVIGGGMCGTAAAIGAAREGRKTLLVEKSGALGGAATVNLVNPFMKCTYKKNSETREILNLGIFLEVMNRLGKMYKGFKGFEGDGYVGHFNEEYLKLVLDNLCSENNVNVLFHSMFTGAECDDNGVVKRITVSGKSGSLKLEADYFIDCSGDADLAAACGCEYLLGREGDNLCQPMTLCFRIANINNDKFCDDRSEANELYANFKKQGKIKNPKENILAFRHMSDGVIHFNTTRIVKKNPLNVFDLSDAEREARQQVYEMYTFLRENISGFENSTLLMSASEIGVRESRKIIGEYVINAEDIMSCRKFEDSIACGGYNIDIHSPDGAGTKLVPLSDDDYYTIPYRSLIPKKTKNLLVAGRSISSTHEAQSAYRIMPIVCAIGEAAGIAIAQICEKKADVRDIDIDLLHKTMDKYGARYN